MRVRRTLTLLALPAALALAGCGEEGIELSKSDPLYRGAEIFNERCSGCHTFEAAGAEGSATGFNTERKDGPNFDIRKEQYEDVLYAIQNGGFSSGPMPQNIATGDDARYVACFVATFSGKDAAQEPSPGGATETPQSSGDCKQELNAG